ncbi:BNR-4 repeat-containing protein, partial [Streptosporangium sp. NPDC006013]|uniref:BNR-4 repeat-containing protein n=1 Tax=Streptosporangium sp. NPDC006013 TaxID=3155596 RepID=UPI0033BCC5BB
NALVVAAEEASIVVVRSAYSTFIVEGSDASAAAAQAVPRREAASEQRVPSEQQGGRRAVPVVERLPFAVDTSNQAGWWRPLDLFGGVTYFAYNAPAAAGGLHEVHVAARGAAGTWTSGCLRTAAGACVTYGDDVGHNQPSIVVDGEGHVHAFVSMHNHPWRYYRTTRAGDVTSLVEAGADLPDGDLRFTYPVTARGGDGDAYVMVRADQDAQRMRGGRLYRFDTATHTWSRVAVIAAATGHAFYPDDLKVDPRGRVHILWEWGPWPATALRHLGSYLVYDPADGFFRDVTGAVRTVPVTPGAGEPLIYQPFVEGETITSESPAVQTAKIALNGNLLHGIAYRYRPASNGGAFAGFDVRYATWNGSAWNRETVADRTEAGAAVETSAAIDATHSAGKTRVYFVAQASGCGGTRSRVVVAERPASGGRWRFTTVGDVQRGLQRLRALPQPGGTDVLYVTAPLADGDRGGLWRALAPRAGRPVTGQTFPQVVQELLGSGANGVNLALGARVTVSSTLRADTGGEKAVDGLCTDDSRWISAEADTAPTITVDLGSPAAIDRVRVHSGYTKAPVPGTDVLRDFTVEARVDGLWREVGRITANTSDTVTVDTAGVRADGVRLLVTDPSGSAIDVARVFEMEVIG